MASACVSQYKRGHGVKMPKLATQETQQHKLRQRLCKSEFLLYALELDLAVDGSNASKQPSGIG